MTARLPAWKAAAALVCFTQALDACGPSTDPAYSGTVQAPSAAIGSPIGGRVTAVNVQEGRNVRAGDVIVRFDNAQQRAALANARHEAAAAAAALADLQAGARAPDLARAADQARQAREQFESANLAIGDEITALRGQLAQAQAQARDARADAKDAATDAARTRALTATGDLSAQTRDAADSREARTRAQVEAAQAAVAIAQAQVRNAEKVTLPHTAAAARAASDAARNSLRLLAAGSRPDALRQAAASLSAARSNVASAQARLNDTIVRAPADGMVSAFDLHVGDLIPAGAVVATIDEDGEPYVRIFVPQSALNHITIGARAVVHPDSQPGISLSGVVEAIDEQAQFTPQNVQTVEDRAALSFGVKVRIHDRDQHVHGGTTATVTLP
jgi:HlyD family secretion protein